VSGIAGIVRLTHPWGVREEDLDRMLSALEPDTSGRREKFVDNKQGIAVGQVAYGPCAEPSNPLPAGEAPRVFLVGELHNDQAQSARSDSEYLRSRYASGDTAWAKDIHGSFAAAIVEPAAGVVVLMTDHMNSCPLFVSRHEGCLYFASEVKGLTALEHLPCRPNTSGVLSVLTSSQFLGTETLVENIRALDYATVWRISNGKIEKHKVWDFRIADAPEDRGKAFYLEEIKGRLRRAVRRCTRRGRVAVTLSGGNDSRTIVGFMDDPTRIQAVTYTAREESDRHPQGDVAVAGRLAALLGMHWRIIRYDPGKVLKAIEDSVYYSDGAAGFVHGETWEHVHHRIGADFVLIGDECFGLTFGPVPEDQVLDCVLVRSLPSLPELWPYLNPDRLDEFLECSASACRRVQASRAGRPTYNQVEEFWHCQGLGRMFNPKRSMLRRYGLGVRRPLLDRDVLDLVKALPYRYRRGRWLVYKALAETNRAVGKLPRARYTETARYDTYLASLEQEKGAVSSFVLEDNPLLEQYLDVGRVAELIRSVAAAGRSAPAVPPRGWRNLLPPRLQRWLVAKGRRLLNVRRATFAGPADILLRIALLAETLRHVHYRCADSRRGF